MGDINHQYGVKDASYKAAGEYDGIKKLVDRFYGIMDSLQEAKTIREMHTEDLEIARDKLTRFLCGWLGGPRLFKEKYGTINIPAFHQHLEIGISERDAWLSCMQQAIEEQPYAEPFKEYLLNELRKPAEKIRQASMENK